MGTIQMNSLNINLIRMLESLATTTKNYNGKTAESGGVHDVCSYTRLLSLFSSLMMPTDLIDFIMSVGRSVSPDSMAVSFLPMFSYLPYFFFKNEATVVRLIIVVFQCYGRK